MSGEFVRVNPEQYSDSLKRAVEEADNGELVRFDREKFLDPELRSKANLDELREDAAAALGVDVNEVDSFED